MSSPLVLVGAPASGKSVVGAALARRLDRPHLDTDLLAAESLGGSLSEAWACLPAEEIRSVIARTCLDALREPAVVSLSSAAVLEAEVVGALAGQQVAWLEVSAAVAARRLGMGVLGMDALVAIRRELVAQIDQRSGLYQQVAGVRIGTDRLSVDDVVDAVVRNCGGCE